MSKVAESLIRGSSKKAKQKRQRNKGQTNTARQKKTVGGKEDTVHFQSWPYNQIHKYFVLAKTSTF